MKCSKLLRYFYFLTYIEALLELIHISFYCQSIFNSLISFDVESFISFWDFLNKRFFFHLDSEHLHLSGVLKSDLIKFYLVHAIKTKNKDKVTEFFAAYSHEILAEAGNFIPGNLRNWFVLPYMDEPEKDAEFSAYFAQRWADLLKNTLHNFLSVVLSSAPPPKLLLLEKWFRSEAQQEIRSQLKQAAKKIDALIGRIEQQEDRMQSLRETVKILATLLYQAITTQGTGVGGGNNNSSSNSSSSRAGNVTSGSNSGSGGNGNDGEGEADLKRSKAKNFGLEVARIATNCLKKSAALQALPREERLLALLGTACSAVVFNASSSGAGWPAYYDAPTGAPEEGGRGETLTTSSGGGGGGIAGGVRPGLESKAALLTSAVLDIDMDALEGDLVRTVQDWSTILS